MNSQTLMIELHRLLSLPGVDLDRVRKIESLSKELLVRSETERGMIQNQTHALLGH
jgi:hypothetical protein